ncbi:MAG: phosphomethylpyrimidine synthase ThiC [Proteobacteria bacterium]|nr:phosphomethylpyrimidine synthase ThiC [Pseudomonadota bacterium]
MTQLIEARKGNITAEMKEVALQEGLEPEFIRKGVADGNIAICRNNKHKKIPPLGIGKGLKTKVNANIGTSRDIKELDCELEKLDVAIKAGADAIMDLSTGGDVDLVRSRIMEKSTVIVGTVPIYQAALETFNSGRPIFKMTEDEIFDGIEKHLADGVDFITVHCGVTKESVHRLRTEGRIMDVVSRGGSFLTEWILKNKKENPLFEDFDRLLEMTKKYDAVLSLGDGFRPGCIADATDRGQIQELLILGELTERAWDAGVQVMIEGPGHVPINQVEANILLQKRICHGAPFYVLGPLVTDIAPGYDHITAAIGGTVAAAAGADFLCYVTPAEHLRLPAVEDVHEGIMATRIAAHAGDIAKGVKGAWEMDLEMSRKRKALDWEGQIAACIDPDKARRLRDSAVPMDAEDACTMCAALCSMKLMNEGEDQKLVKK